MKTIYSDKYPLVVGCGKGKGGDLPLNMCFAFQNNSYNNISKCVMGYYPLIPIKALKQMGT